MSKSLNIVFFGTPEFATGVLDKIHKSHHNIVAVVTAPDKPAGRGRKINQSDVKKYAVEHDLPVLQPTNLKSEEFLNNLKSFKADLQVIVAFRMLPRAVWEMPALGTFNLHASLLPQYRGAAPINWAIINQEKETGVTTFFIDDKIDTGAIIAQTATPIRENEDVGSLYNRLMKMGAELSLETVNQIADGNIATTIQKESTDLKDAPKLNNKNTLIDFSKSAQEVDAMVRGLFPYPVAKACLYNKEHMIVKIHKASIVEKNHLMTPGSFVVEDHKIIIACGKNMIAVEEIQLPNKKRMKVKDLLNGFSFDPDARFDAGCE